MTNTVPIARPTSPALSQPSGAVPAPVDSQAMTNDDSTRETAEPVGAADWNFAASLSRAALAWHRPHLSEQQVVQAITDTAVTLLPGAVGAAMLTRRGTRQLQLTASAGSIPPRIQALRMDDNGHAPLYPGGLRLPAQRTATAHQRSGWPIATAASRGRTAMVYVPLGLRSTMFGTLLINTDAPVTAHTETCAVTLAMHACTAIAAARERDRLRTAVDTRDVIGQAKGILMERRRTTPDAALAELVRISKITHTDLRDLCSYLCTTGELPALRTAPNVGAASRLGVTAVTASPLVGGRQ